VLQQWSWNLIWEWRLTLPSFGLANRQISHKPAPNLIWEWRVTLPSFGLANRQKHVCLPNCIQPGLRTPCGLATGLHVSNNCKSHCRLILAPCAYEHFHMAVIVLPHVFELPLWMTAGRLLSTCAWLLELHASGHMSSTLAPVQDARRMRACSQHGTLS
jgi:hypothetical protein